MPRRCMLCRRCSGFTLVELLVVIGIIALLVGILLPALNKARQQGNIAACLSNLRQIDQALMMYVSDNKGHVFPYVYKPVQLGWPSILQQYVSLNGTSVYNYNGQPILKGGPLLCPSAQDPTPAGFKWAGQTQGGTAFNCWGPSATVKMTLQYPNGTSATVQLTGSYGFNSWLYRLNADETDPNQIASDTQVEKYCNDNTNGQASTDTPGEFWNLPHIGTDTTKIPAFCDSVWNDGACHEDDPWPNNFAGYNLGTGYAGGNYGMDRILINRHNMAINVAFLDGHAENVPLINLWGLYWHQNWDGRLLVNGRLGGPYGNGQAPQPIEKN